MRVQFSEGTDRLTRAYPTLSPQLKKAAAYILDHPSEVATFSMRQVAARADVPPSTMIRLARAVGLPTYGEFRALYRDSINDQSVGYPLGTGQAHAVAHESDHDHALNAFHQASINIINTMFDRLDRAALERAVQSLAVAHAVFVVGTHGSHSSAGHLKHMTTMGFRNWHMLVRTDAEYSRLLEALAPNDVVVCIAVEPCAADTIRLAQHAREVGARVIGITDKRTSPLAACSDDILLIPVRSPSFFPSYVGATALVEVLVGMIAARSDRSAVENADKLERLRRSMGDYWSE